MRDSNRVPTSMVRYRLIDDRDGSVLAVHASAEEALRSFGRLARDPHVRVRVSVELTDMAVPACRRSRLSASARAASRCA